MNRLHRSGTRPVGRNLFFFPLLIASLTVAAAPAFASEDETGPKVRPLGGKPVKSASALEVARAKSVDQISISRPACVEMQMTCNSTVNGRLTADDCLLEEDDTVVDFWLFQGSAGQQVTIDATSSDFDMFLVLLDPTPEVVAIDDDTGAGTDSRIVFDLNQSGEWAIGVNNFFPQTGDPGDYSVTLQCSGTAPGAPGAPSNLTATPLSDTEVDLFWNDNANNETEFRIELRTGGGAFQDIGSVPANSGGAAISNLNPATTYDFRVRARNGAGNSGYSNIATATTFGGECVSNATTLCLNDNRFRVTVNWRDFQSQTGPGLVVPFGSDDSGLFYFFDPDNWEMLIKVLDGCSISNNFWVFFAATTNVEFELTVTDTVSNQTNRYINPLGNPADAVTDTRAFATCP